ncbi:MAG: GSCFA domain-containing protein [Cyclobacteriaceae bacterium]|nr:GSCFA domain-containing protein [Cyclobacteriaceae bacterium]
MQFRTQIPVSKNSLPIKLGDKFVTLGSCFANSMDAKLSEAKFATLNNPLGILYDPRSIARAINFALTGNRPDNQTYINTGNEVVNLLAHSDMNGKSIEDSKAKIDTQLSNLHIALKEANWLIITLGTSWVYYQNSTGLQAANCHKIAQKEFTKGLLEFERTKLVYDNLLEFLKTFNPTLKIIITVSPVRHTKDTLALNNLSKSHLFLLSHYLDQTYEQVSYYPAYELLVDDLRDYRFYKQDMIHPTEQAVEYIWQYFSESYFDAETLKSLKELEQLQKALHHKPFSSSSEKHQQFIKNTLAKFELLNSKLNVEKEIAELKSQLQG